MACLAGVTGCQSADEPAADAPGGPASSPASRDAGPCFEDVAAEAGVNFVWKSGHTDAFLMPEVVGGGAALIDYDSDGDLDIYFVQGGDVRAAWPDGSSGTAANRLYRNDGSMRFTDVTSETGAGNTGYGMGVAVGDIDGDADPDLYITNAGQNAMLRNDGGVFTDITASSGTGHDGWGASAIFFDADLDGDLDLYATNYLDWSPETEMACFSPLGGEDYCSPRNYLAPARDLFFRNEGGGRFTDATAEAGFDAAQGTGLGVITGDWDGNGRPDLFVANDGMADLLWMGQSDGTWIETGMNRGCALDDEGIAKAGMGVDTNDIDDDGDLDIIVCNLTGESDSIFRNDGDYFVDITGRSGIRSTTRHATRFGLGWIDFNHDGYLDLYEANGAVAREPAAEGEDPYAQINAVLHGNGRGRFEPHPLGDGTAHPARLTSRAAAFGDLDGDGAIDIVVVNRDAPANVYRNLRGEDGHWVRVRVVDESGRPALGATLRGRVGERTVTRPVRRGWSYLASNDPTVHVGLGDAPALEEVRIHWPDASTSRHGTLAADAVHVLSKPAPSKPNP